MNEKRFKLNDKGSFILEDGEPLKPLGNVVHKLNEQQDTITRLKEENKELEDEYDDFSNFLIDKGLEFEFEKWCKDE